MRKQIFITTMQQAQAEDNTEAILQTIMDHARHLAYSKRFVTNDLDGEAVSLQVATKVWFAGYLSHKTPLDIYRLLPRLVKTSWVDYMVSLGRMTKKRKNVQVMSLSSCEEDEEGCRTCKEFKDECMRSPLDELIEKEEKYDFVNSVLHSGELHLMVQRFEIKRKYFGSSQVSLPAILRYVDTMGLVSGSELNKIASTVEHIEPMPVAKVFNRIYNENKKHKKQGARSAA